MQGEEECAKTVIRVIEDWLKAVLVFQAP